MSRIVFYEEKNYAAHDDFIMGRVKIDEDTGLVIASSIFMDQKGFYKLGPLELKGLFSKYNIQRAYYGFGITATHTESHAGGNIKVSGKDLVQFNMFSHAFFVSKIDGKDVVTVPINYLDNWYLTRDLIDINSIISEKLIEDSVEEPQEFANDFGDLTCMVFVPLELNTGLYSYRVDEIEKKLGVMENMYFDILIKMLGSAGIFIKRVLRSKGLDIF